MGILSLVQRKKSRLADKAADGILEKMRRLDVMYTAKELKLPDHVKLSTEFYVEVAPGVLDRILEGPNDIKYSFEKPFANIISRVNFSKKTVVIVRSVEQGKFPPHWHSFHEEIICLSGGYRGLCEPGYVIRVDDSSGDSKRVKSQVDKDYVFRPGDHQIIPPGPTHVHRYDIEEVGPDGHQYSIIIISE